MADPLTLLRQYNVNKKEIIERDDQIIFGDVTWCKTVKTNYIMWGSIKEGSPKEYYTLDCLLFLLKNVTLTHPVYVRQAAAVNIPVVRRPDRKDLLAYLNGELVTTISIDRAASLEMLSNQPKRAAGDSLQSVCKRPRLDTAADVPDVPEVPVVPDVPEEPEEPEEPVEPDAPKTPDESVEPAGPEGDSKVVRCISDAMPVEKIASIKAKCLAKKQTGSGYMPDEDGTNDRTKAIIARERNGRNRHTVLQSSGKDFAKDVLAILQLVKAREEGWTKPPIITPPVATPKSNVLVGYNRYDQQRFIRHKEEVEGFRIDTMGTYHGMTLKSVTEGNHQKQLQEEEEEEEVVEEDPQQQKQNPEQEQQEQQSPFQKYQLQPLTSGSSLPGTSEASGSSLPIKRTSRTPIIIIPAAPTSLITMYNAKDVLQDLRFVTTEEKKHSGHRRDNEVLLQRHKDAGFTVPYRVIDNPLKLRDSDWDRVVATFVMGPAWQFKGWPWGGRPVDIFSKVCAFHLKYDEMLLDHNVGRWAVQVIELSRCRRHLDRAALMVFWEILDRHMVRNKPYLRF